MKSLEGFHLVSFNYLSCSKNQFVDALTTLSSIIKILKKLNLRPIVVETHDHAIYCHNIAIELDSNPGYHDIKAFLKDGSYLESTSSANKRKVRKLAYPFFPNGVRSYDGILLR